MGSPTFFVSYLLTLRPSQIAQVLHTNAIANAVANRPRFGCLGLPNMAILYLVTHEPQVVLNKQCFHNPQLASVHQLLWFQGKNLTRALAGKESTL